MMPRPIALALVLAALVMVGSPASAAKAVKAAPATVNNLSPADRALVEKAAAYLQGLKSAQARFSQTDPRGQVTTGTFSLQRPGKARFAYDPPADLTVVADGISVNVLDGKLKTFDHYPLKQTPLSMLLSEQVTLGKGMAVAGVSRESNGFTVTLRDPAKQAEGRLSLSFSASPMTLTGWSVVDAQKSRTTVRLTGLRTGVGLEPSLFVLKDPHPHTFKP